MFKEPASAVAEDSLMLFIRNPAFLRGSERLDPVFRGLPSLLLEFG